MTHITLIRGIGLINRHSMMIRKNRMASLQSGGSRLDLIAIKDQGKSCHKRWEIKVKGLHLVLSSLKPKIGKGKTRLSWK